MPKSGFCSIGHHEGGRYPGPSGKFNKTCTFIDSCSCDDPTCHTFFNRMFNDSEMDRVAVDNSGYEPQLIEFAPFERTIVEAAPILSNDPPDIGPETLESVAPGLVPPVNRGSYGPTSSGRAARGQLEDQVNRACITWAVEQEKSPCTPQYLAYEIGRLWGIKNPSTGAISAVFDRWEKIGYAEIGRKPTRFLGFTPAAIEYGLDWIKNRAKRQEKTEEASRLRGARV